MAQGNYREEFPEFGELDVVLPDGFVDVSWHNDAMPSFERRLPDGSTVKIWVDYADRGVGDFPGAPRFGVQHQYEDDEMTAPLTITPSLDTDDWDEVDQYVATVVHLTVPRA